MKVVVIVGDIFHSRWSSLPHVQRIPLALFETWSPLFPLLPEDAGVLYVTAGISLRARKVLHSQTRGTSAKFRHTTSDHEAKQIVLKYKQEKKALQL